MITIVGIASAKGALKELVDHVTKEESLPSFAAFGLRDVRKHFFLQNVLRGSDTTIAGYVMGLSSTLSNII
ncbi:hypothetical protein PC116_g34397 [Phytophthora cactorum]|nr:hypothetical protein PC116_g34397 [Phytophthora cactorum]